MVPQLGNRLHFQEELQRLEEQALGGLDLVGEDARPDARGGRASRTSSSRRW